MPNINIDDAYILGETGAEVDKVTGLFTKNENATTGEKQMARLNIAAGGSNRNLLDNAYFVGGGSQLGDGVFPINQRGQSSYSGNGNIFDRWTLQNAFANLAADAVYFGSTTQNVLGLMQQVPSRYNALWGKTVTVSAFIGDELVQETYTVPQSGAFDMPAAGTGGVFVNLYSYDGSNIVFRIYTQYTASYHIKSVKLELGTVSTLANDPVPDFGAELAKCQRYLYIPTFPWYAWTGTLAMATSATDFNWVINTPVPMRQGAIPTIGITGSVYINNTAASNLSIVNAPVGNLVKISGTSAGMTNGQLYPVNTSADNVSVILSAEL